MSASPPGGGLNAGVVGSDHDPLRAEAAATLRVRVRAPAALRGRAEAAPHHFRVLAPGFALAAVVGLTAHLVATLAFPYALAIGVEVPLAMLVGLVVVNLGGVAADAIPGIRFAVKYVLGLGIILLGLRLNLHSIVGIGSEALLLVIGAMTLALAFAVLVGRRLGVERRVAVLIGIGSAVCGNSAIAAAAPVVRANDRQLCFAAATITIFGTLAVLAFPLIGHALGLDVLTFGLWAGVSVPDTAQTVAASAAYDTVGRDVAVVVKLLRTVLLAPILLLILWSFSRTGDGDVSADAARLGVRKAIPFFVVGFVALALLRTSGLVDGELAIDLDPVTRACFLVALAGLGLQTAFGNFRDLGLRPFLLGAGTFTAVAVGTLAAILAFGLGPARTEAPGSVDPRPLGAWEPVCEEGARPIYAGAFVSLAERLGDEMGSAVACAEFDATAGELVQRTSRGVATLEAETGALTFSTADRTWELPASATTASSHGASAPGAGAMPAPAPPAEREPADGAALMLTAEVMATGIPGASAVSPVGSFHPGGPMHDKADFAATTAPGEVLDPTRLLVASSSNFGAPRSRGDWAPGAILSLATDAPGSLEIPRGFADEGEQASILGGAARLYTAQSPAFLNRLPNAGAETADMPAVARPLGISVNNAFGRPWFASSTAPGAAGTGVESVLDPDGRPLSEAPSTRAGGVFADALTNRDAQRRPGGLEAGAIGNAFLGASPDASGRAVFAVATADGALAQVHVEDGVDGLAPPGTIAPLAERSGSGVATRVGMAFNWVPDRFLYVTDPRNDAILQLRLEDDFRTFEVAATRRLQSAQLSAPVDLAPAVPEVANPAFSSNTTLAGGADLYVANRGSGTIVRLRQDGKVRAVAEVEVPGLGAVGPGVLNGLAVSPDARTLWVSLSGAPAQASGLSGSVVEIPAFGAPD